MKIYFATWMSDVSLGNSLTKKKVSRRLASFYFIKYIEMATDQIQRYVSTGRCEVRKSKMK